MRVETGLTIGPRYWAAMFVASMCGANLGDFVADELHIGHLRGLPALTVLFAIIVIADWWSKRGGEGWYWLAILVVRTAATNLADSAIAGAGLGYATVAAGLAVLLTAIILVGRVLRPAPLQGGLPRINSSYWLAMLVAGTLGTVIADGMAHMIRPVTLGVPVSGLTATLAVASILGLRTRAGFRSVATYWIAIVAVRGWGTNVGDISAYLLSRPVSILLSGLLLIALLVLWPRTRKILVPATA